jgi:hypothetical protein
MGKNQEGDEFVWDPYLTSLYDWILEKKIGRYFVIWRKGRDTDSHERIGDILIGDVLTKEQCFYINEIDNSLLLKLKKAVQRDIHTEELAEIVLKADQKSTAEDLKRSNLQTDLGTNIAVPAFRHYIDAMRRLFALSKWDINNPGSRVWVIDDKLFLVWPAAGEDIKELLLQDGVNVFKDPKSIFEVLTERDFFQLPEDGRFWRILPDVLQDNNKKEFAALYALQVAQPEILLDVLPPSTPGLILPDIEDEKIKEIIAGNREVPEFIEQDEENNNFELTDTDDTDKDTIEEKQQPKEEQPERQPVEEKTEKSVEAVRPADKIKIMVEQVQYSEEHQDLSESGDAERPDEIDPLSESEKQQKPEKFENKTKETDQKNKKVSLKQIEKGENEKETDNKNLEEKFKEAKDFFSANDLLAEVFSAVAQDISENRKEIGKDILLGADIALSWQPKSKFSDGLGVQAGEILREMREQRWIKQNPATPNGYAFNIDGKKYLILEDEPGEHFSNMIKYFQKAKQETHQKEVNETKQPESKEKEISKKEEQKSKQESKQKETVTKSQVVQKIEQKTQETVGNKPKKINNNKELKENMNEEEKSAKKNIKQSKKDKESISLSIPPEEDWIKIIDEQISQNGRISRKEVQKLLRKKGGLTPNRLKILEKIYLKRFDDDKRIYFTKRED